MKSEKRNVHETETVFNTSVVCIVTLTSCLLMLNVSFVVLPQYIHVDVTDLPIASGLS